MKLQNCCRRSWTVIKTGKFIMHIKLKKKETMKKKKVKKKETLRVFYDRERDREMEGLKQWIRTENLNSKLWLFTALQVLFSLLSLCAEISTLNRFEIQLVYERSHNRCWKIQRRCRRHRHHCNSRHSHIQINAHIQIHWRWHCTMCLLCVYVQQSA